MVGLERLGCGAAVVGRLVGAVVALVVFGVARVVVWVVVGLVVVVRAVLVLDVFVLDVFALDEDGLVEDDRSEVWLGAFRVAFVRFDRDLVLCGVVFEVRALWVVVWVASGFGFVGAVETVAGRLEVALDLVGGVGVGEAGFDCGTIVGGGGGGGTSRTCQDGTLKRGKAGASLAGGGTCSDVCGEVCGGSLEGAVIVGGKSLAMGGALIVGAITAGTSGAGGALIVGTVGGAGTGSDWIIGGEGVGVGTIIGEAKFGARAGAGLWARGAGGATGVLGILVGPASTTRTGNGELAWVWFLAIIVGAGNNGLRKTNVIRSLSPIASYIRWSNAGLFGCPCGEVRLTGGKVQTPNG